MGLCLAGNLAQPTSQRAGVLVLLGGQREHSLADAVVLGFGTAASLVRGELAGSLDGHHVRTRKALLRMRNDIARYRSRGLRCAIDLDERARDLLTSA